MADHPLNALNAPNARKAVGAGVALAMLASGCGGGGSAGGASGASTEAPARRANAFVEDEPSWAKFPSKRFGLTLPLPDGRSWRIDDRTTARLVATHEPTSSRVELAVTHEQGLMTRATCEARARAQGLVREDLGTVEDQAITGPGTFDTRVWVGMAIATSGDKSGRAEGHVYAFGGSLRSCLFFHFVSQAEARDEDVLATRLAIARTRILEGVALAASRTDADLTLPRARPSTR